MKWLTREEVIEKRQQAETGFTNLDLSGVVLSMIDLSRVNLRGSDLSGANLTSSNLLRVISLTETTMPDGKKFDEENGDSER